MAITRIHRWAKSAKNRDISLVSSDTLESLEGRSPILLMGGVHGDEPEGLELAKSLLVELEESKEDLVPWILIPCLNPDGMEAGERVNGNGVDLNRNYPSQNWSNAYEKERYFPGASPGSEPEISALVQLIQKWQPRLMIHFHSWEPCIVYTGEPGKNDAQRLSIASGYDLKDDIGYPTSGSLSSFGWKDLRIPVICIEEREGIEVSSIGPRFVSALIDILKDHSPRK